MATNWQQRPAVLEVFGVKAHFKACVRLVVSGLLYSQQRLFSLRKSREAVQRTR